MRNKSTLIVAALLIVGAVGFLIVGSTGSTARYFLTVVETLELEERAERDVTVSGAVVHSSIDYDVSVPRLTFSIAHVPGTMREVEDDGGLPAVLARASSDPTVPRLDVVYEGVMPDRLPESPQVILRGRMGDDGRFHADEVRLKCPSRYEADQEGASGAE